MNISLYSDLHTEFFEDRPPWTPDDVGCDVLVLAGDIVTSPKALTEYISRIRAEWGRPVPIVYTMGNHEYYGQEFHSARKAYLLRSSIPNFHPLDRGTVEIDGVVFAGATLWTDFRNGADLELAVFSMNDYQRIKNAVTEWNWNPIDAWEQFKLSLDFLHDVVAAQWGKPLVMVTHHAPSFQSCDKSFHDTRLNGCYASALDYYIQEWKPRLWLHGHVHTTNNYRIGDTTIMSNARGYDMVGDRSYLNPHFNPEILVTL